jgi:REP-associated tyrosine transposase
MEELERQIETVRNNPKKGPEARIAKKFLIEQLIARGFKRNEIAERLQMSPKTIYNFLKKPLPVYARSHFR